MRGRTRADWRREGVADAKVAAVCCLVAAVTGLVTGCSAARGPAEAAPGAAGGRWNVLPADVRDSGLQSRVHAPES